MDFVITVCDQAAGEQCPIWPGRQARTDRSLPDPAAVTGSDDEKRQAFLDTYTELKRRIGEFAASAPTRPHA
jgi:arsenate reductase